MALRNCFKEDACDLAEKTIRLFANELVLNMIAWPDRGLVVAEVQEVTTVKSRSLGSVDNLAG